MNMRRTPVAYLVAPRIGAGLDSAETIVAVFVGQHPSAAAKVRVDRRQVLIFLMPVASARVGLPDFDQRIFHWSAKSIANVAVDDYPFANRQAVFGVVEDQVVIERAEIVAAEHRSGDFRKGILQGNERIARRAQHAGFIARGVSGRMAAVVAVQDLAR